MTIIRRAAITLIAATALTLGLTTTLAAATDIPLAAWRDCNAVVYARVTNHTGTTITFNLSTDSGLYYPALSNTPLPTLTNGTNGTYTLGRSPTASHVGIVNITLADGATPIFPNGRIVPIIDVTCVTPPPDTTTTTPPPPPSSDTPIPPAPAEPVTTTPDTPTTPTPTTTIPDVNLGAVTPTTPSHTIALPATGATVNAIVALGVGLVFLGVALVIRGRRPIRDDA